MLVPIDRKTDRDTEQLFGLLDTKWRLLLEMRELSILQSDVVARQDVSELMALLARKEVLMDRLMQLQHALSPFAAQDPEKRLWSSPERRRDCQQIKARCDALVQEMLVMENRSIDHMHSQREMVANQLQQVTDSIRLAQAYASVSSEPDESGSSVSYDG
jgi:hypothetical protein